MWKIREKLSRLHRYLSRKYDKHYKYFFWKRLCRSPMLIFIKYIFLREDGGAGGGENSVGGE